MQNFLNIENVMFDDLAFSSQNPAAAVPAEKRDPRNTGHLHSQGFY
jgi:hypothetical protein